MAVRSLSGVFGVLALPLAWRLGDRVGGPRAARWTLVLVALSPFAVRYSTESRMYSLVMLLGLLLALAVDGVLRRPQPLRMASVAVLSRRHALDPLLVDLPARRDRDPARSCGSGATSRPAGRPRRAIGSIVAGGVLFLPWLPVFLDQLAHTGTPWARSVPPDRRWRR